MCLHVFLSPPDLCLRSKGRKEPWRHLWQIYHVKSGAGLSALLVREVLFSSMPVRSFGDQLLCFFPHHVWRTTQGRRIEAEHLALHRVTLVYVVIVIAYGQWLLMRFYKVKDASFSHGRHYAQLSNAFGCHTRSRLLEKCMFIAASVSCFMSCAL